jgi:hypothetical protein
LILLRTALFLLPLALCSEKAAAQWGDPCSGRAEAGWIARIDYVPTEADRARPRILRGSAELQPSEGAALCEDDVITNPRGSSQKLWIRLSDRELVEIAAGDGHFLVRAPSWFAKAREWLKPLDGLALWRQRARTRTTPARTRGGPDRCRYTPLSHPEGVARVVPQWGPIVLAWPCTRSGSREDWRVEVDTGQGIRSLSSVTNMISLDTSVCRPACTVIVEEEGMEVPLFTARLQAAGKNEAGLPPRLARRLARARERVEAGALLLGRDDQLWRLQAMSLLWLSGCEVPSAGRAASLIYGAPALEDLCSGRDR